MSNSNPGRPAIHETFERELIKLEVVVDVLKILNRREGGSPPPPSPRRRGDRPSWWQVFGSVVDGDGRATPQRATLRAV